MSFPTLSCDLVNSHPGSCPSMRPYLGLLRQLHGEGHYDVFVNCVLISFLLLLREDPAYVIGELWSSLA